MAIAHNTGRKLTTKTDSGTSSNATFWQPASGKTIVLDGFVVEVVGSINVGNYVDLTDGTAVIRFAAAGGAAGGTVWSAQDLNIQLASETDLQITVAAASGTVIYHVSAWGHEVTL